MHDDDIPVLTTVVKRERRADLTMTAEVRQAIIDAVAARADALLGELIDSASELLRDTLTSRLRDEMPGLVDAVLREQLEEMHRRKATAND